MGEEPIATMNGQGGYDTHGDDDSSPPRSRYSPSYYNYALRPSLPPPSSADDDSRTLSPPSFREGRHIEPTGGSSGATAEGRFSSADKQGAAAAAAAGGKKRLTSPARRRESYNSGGQASVYSIPSGYRIRDILDINADADAAASAPNDVDEGATGKQAAARGMDSSKRGGSHGTVAELLEDFQSRIDIPRRRAAVNRVEDRRQQQQRRRASAPDTNGTNDMLEFHEGDPREEDPLDGGDLADGSRRRFSTSDMVPGNGSGPAGRRGPNDDDDDDGMMADYIALKLKVAELSSALQVAQGHDRQARESLRRVEERNSQLEKENSVLLLLLSNLEQRVLGKPNGERKGLKLEGLEKKMTLGRIRGSNAGSVRNVSWKKPNLDWGNIHDSDRSPDPRPTATVLAAAEKESRTQHRKPSWLMKRRQSCPDLFAIETDNASCSKTGDDAMLMAQDLSRTNDTTTTSYPKHLYRRSSSAELDGNQSLRASLVETIKNIPRSFSVLRVSKLEAVPNNSQDSNQRQELRRGRRSQPKQPQSQKKQKEKGDDVVMPEYVQFIGDEVGIAVDMRCSEVTIDWEVVQKMTTSLSMDTTVSEGDRSLRYSKESMHSTLLESENNNEDARSKGESSGAESFSLWQSTGPLGYSMTDEDHDVLEYQGSGGGAPDETIQPKQSPRRGGEAGGGKMVSRLQDRESQPRVQCSLHEHMESEDENWTPSEFAFSSQGTSSPRG